MSYNSYKKLPQIELNHFQFKQKIKLRNSNAIDTFYFEPYSQKK